jgi:23S rRNA-intervening sequence protein
VRSQVQILSPRFFRPEAEKIEQESGESSKESKKSGWPLSCGLLTTFYLPVDYVPGHRRSALLINYNVLAASGHSPSRIQERAVAFDFEKLLVYQKAVDLADQVCARTEHFQPGYCFLVDQLDRAALSISANIGEGDGRFTKADWRNTFANARGSTQ